MSTSLRAAGRRSGILCGALLATFMLAAPAFAQDAAQIAAGKEVWNFAGCSGCHGAAGEGGLGGERPAGPSLQKTQLEPEMIHETVACGRPGTEMPSFLKGAYITVECYGMPLGKAEAKVLPILEDAQITDLVAYLMAEIVRKK